MNRLQPLYEQPPSTFAFNFNLRRYMKGDGVRDTERADVQPRVRAVRAWVVTGSALHSSSFRLNVSTFCWIRCVHDFPQSIRQGDTVRCDQNGLG